MASGLTTAGEAAVLTPLTTTVFVSLHTSALATNPPTNEVTGGAYARQGAIAFTNAGNNPTVASNSAILTFPAATAPWGTINQFALWSAVTAGNMLGWGDLTTPKTVNSGDTARFATGSLTITVN